jgi:gamma-glutamyltranspeptidase/glutathione hydrolase
MPGEPLEAVARATDGFTTRPVIAGRHGVVCAGHYLAASAGLHILRRGGNAIDAAVAMGFCSAVLEPHLNGVGGESPILIHHAKSKRVVAVNGQGTAPQAATIEWFRSEGIDLIPGDGLLAATVPSQVDNWITALAQFGTLSLEAVLSPAIEMARDGFPMYRALSAGIGQHRQRFEDEWPSSAAIYLPGGRVPGFGEVFRNPDWAQTFELLIDEERAGAGRGRVAALEQARNRFYRGDIAEKIAAFCRDTKVLDATGQSRAGLLVHEDMAGFHARVEPAVHVDHAGLEVHKCGPWTQGPVFLQQLRLLEGFDLAAMGHNSADYIHTWIECAKLAFADREFYYGDPAFADVPIETLLSSDYARQRRSLIDPRRASHELRPGDAGPRPKRLPETSGAGRGHDTTHVCAIDAEGNMMAATPSGGWIPSSPVVPGLGFPLGTRGQMFWLDPEHPDALQPGKRPRTTLTPSLVMKQGRPFMVFGTPGGDGQDQWTNQFFLNVVHFGMNVQEALDAPTFHSDHFPSSFYPRGASPGVMRVEQRIPAAVREQLERRGHDVRVGGPWSNGRVLGIHYDSESGVIFGGASPRGETGYAMGW